ncbi:MAG: acetate uptake transporter family protein [Thermoanaerobaculaceae bacterium]
MIRKAELGRPVHTEVIAEPTPVGLVCLAIGCAALVPIAFGHSLTPAGLRTAAMFCLLFGAGGQLVAGIGNLINRNLYGGTLFTAFAFNWVLNWWALDGLSRGVVPDPGIVFAVDVCFLVIFLVFTYGFGFYSKLLLAFLADIDVLYLAKVGKHLGGGAWLDLVVAVCTVALAGISLWIAFALLINPTAGRRVFAFPGPAFAARPRPAFDSSLRIALCRALYAHWQQRAFAPMPLGELEQALTPVAAGRSLEPELAYLGELGAVLRTDSGVRLTAQGLDFFEQVVLGKSSFA